jgi:hypothetical protein
MRPQAPARPAMTRHNAIELSHAETQRRPEGGRRAIFLATIGWQKRKPMLHILLGRIKRPLLLSNGDKLDASPLTEMRCET